MNQSVGYGFSQNWLPMLLVAGSLLTWGNPALASTWNAELQDRRQIGVDPSTNRALIESDKGPGRPLWDGVHRLQDGSTITIRSGIMVPNEALKTLDDHIEPGESFELEHDPSSPSADVRTDGRGKSCHWLVLKTCGLRNGCRDSEACKLARQLRDMQLETAENLDWAEEQCREARNDQRFTPCEQAPFSSAAACRHLIEYVCNSTPRCARSSSCLSARELLNLEQAAIDDPTTEALTIVRERCKELLAEHAFFPPCR